MKHLKSYLMALSLLSSFNGYVTGKTVHAPISLGELVDKITILSIKAERLADPKKRRNVLLELQLLQELFKEYIGDRADIAEIMKELKTTNENLWDIEDILRLKEQYEDFGEDFIAYARSVYITNDHRSILKRKIDTLLGSTIMEEKSHNIY